jgi:hypothetical protein
MLSIDEKRWIQPGREDNTVAILRELASAVGEQELDREICPLFLTDDGGGLCVSGEFMDRQGGYVRPAATGPGA